MRDDRAFILAAGALGVIWLWRRKSTDPVRYEPDTDTAGFFGEPAPEQGGPWTTPAPKSPASGISLGWAPAPVRPAVEMDAWVSVQPAPGKFYQCGRRDRSIEVIAARAVAELARTAAIDAGCTTETAQQWADRARRSPTVVLEAWHSISAGWNDEVYGSPKVEMTAPWGRGIDLRPTHCDVHRQIADGRTPRRNLDTLGNPSLDGPSSRPLLWIPSWDGAYLMRSLGSGQHSPIRAGSWPDGTSGLWPPPAITERGIIYGKRQ